VGIVLGILILSFLVFVHELGHFLAAKWAGVRVETFSIGFGPKLLRKRWGETEYCLSAVLFGGYVKMTGQDDLGQSPDNHDDPKDFRNKSVFQRIQIAFAGPLFNYVFALAVLTVMYMTGVREAPKQYPVVVGHVAEGSAAAQAGFRIGDTLWTLQEKKIKAWDKLIMEIAMLPETELPVTIGRPGGRKTLTLVPKKMGREELGWAGLYRTETVIIESVITESPAARAGIAAGDTVTGIEGEAVLGWNLLVDKIKQAGSTAVNITVKRGPDTLVFSLAPEFQETEKRYMIGIQRKVLLTLNRYGPATAFVKALRHTGNDALLIAKALKGLVQRRLSLKSMAGPVGIVHITGEVARTSFDLLLLFLAMISVNLAIVNLFPFLIITDGGVIFFLLIESFRGRPLSARKQLMIQQIAIFMFIGLFLLVTFNDIFRLLGRP
jgi:regulator of sigma E protease